MIYFTADLHFCHQREFLYINRGFSNVYDMNQAIIRNWNNVVKPEDDVYVLGDLMLNDNREGVKCLHQLQGNLHIIIGNHDTEERLHLYRDSWNVREIHYGQMLQYGKYRFFLSHYPTFTPHIEERPPSREVINLFGHTHQSTNFFRYADIAEEQMYMYHVGVNSHNLTPVSIEEVIADITEKYQKKHPSYTPPVMSFKKNHFDIPQETKKQTQLQTEEQHMMVNVAKEIVSDRLVMDIYEEYASKYESRDFRNVMRYVAPRVYRELQAIAPDEMALISDCAGKMISTLVAEKIHVICGN